MELTSDLGDAMTEISEVRLLQAENDYRIALTAAEAAFGQAAAEVTEAEVNREYSRISAPFDALVLEVAAEAGETVVSRLQARTLVVLAPAGRMRASAWVAAETMDGIVDGAPAEVDVNGRSFSGQVAGIAMEPKPGSDVRPLYRVDVDFEVPAELLLRSGQAASIRTGG
jgi:multidrug resistance efflux pump